jgi:hypothetical protein
MRIEITLPIKLVSELNLREHWSKKSKRHENLRKIVTLAFLGRRRHITLPCQVTLTRVAPNALDFDNLVGAFKSMRDYVADQIIPGLAMGRADGDPRITWQYTQEKGLPKQYACKITIESTNDS